jgi:uncharacterized protein YyaL (SSP411 family)
LNTLDKLVDWFLNSPIFNGEAYLEYYSATRKGSAYPEITGYAISLCCILYEREKDTRFLDRAETCVRYMEKVNKNGGVPCLKDNILYTFDTGVYISSLFDLYSSTKKELYLDDAKKSLKWLYSLWDGRQFAAVNKPPEEKDWYHIPSVHLAKLIIPLMKASKCLKDKKYTETAFELFDKYKQLQEEKGSFKIDESSNAIMVHPHCYATEGFLYAYYASRRQEFLELAKKSSDWLCEMQNPDGSFYWWYGAEKEIKHRDRQERVKASDATAQATRIWKLLGVNRKGIEKAYRYLDSELEDNGLRLYSVESMRESVHSWPTFFYIHSLILPFGQTEYCKELF